MEWVRVDGDQEAILAKANGFRATGVLTFYIDSGIYAALRTYGEENLLGIIPKHFNAAAHSPWIISTPCSFSGNVDLNYRNFQQEQQINLPHMSNDCPIRSFNNLDLSNPFNMIATTSPILSVWSLDSLHYDHNQLNEQQQKQELRTNYFEPLPFTDNHNPPKQDSYPQLSQKHTIIKQSIILCDCSKNKKQRYCHNLSHYKSCDNLFSSTSDRIKRQICSFCKSNDESANVYTSHVLRNTDNEIESPILMAYVCPKCGATGKSAHTIKYCTALSEIERIALPIVKLFKEGRSSSGNMNLFKK
ncbi:unnamed protein product [Rotaria socialis]